MRRSNVGIALSALVVLAAQTGCQKPQQSSDAGQVQQPAQPAPAAGIEAWKVNLDGAGNPADVKFVSMGEGFHITPGSHRAIFFNPANTGTAPYEVRASFTQTAATPHLEAYGIVFGGSDLDADAAKYTYFLARQDGKYAIKHRAGPDNRADVHTVVDWTADPSVKTLDAEGKATNELVVRVGTDSVRFMVNGKQVKAVSRTDMATETEGIAGVRVNHGLDVHVEKFEVRKG